MAKPPSPAQLEARPMAVLRFSLKYWPTMTNAQQMTMLEPIAKGKQKQK